MNILCDLETSPGYCVVQNGAPYPSYKKDVERERKRQRQQENSLNTRTNMNHDPFILKLPPEIASHIFFLSMGERYSGPVCQYGNGLPTPLLLGVVYSGWRRLARSTPELWSRLAFTFYDTGTSLKNKRNTPHLIADWLERSDGLH